jgi:CubicO group peptidase (beta-lactamase class C family)
MKTVRAGKHAGMLFILLFVTETLLVTTCGKSPETPPAQRIDGVLQADYSDSTGVHQRYLTFQVKSDDSITVTLDEPSEDWYDVPVTFARHDTTISLYLWWGIETLNGTFSDTGSTFTGVRNVNGTIEPFVYRKIDGNAILSFNKPFTNVSDTALPTYAYVPPENENDGIPVGLLSDTTSDTARIATMMNRIIDGSIPNIHSVLLVKNGTLVLEEYLYGYSRSRAHRVHSVTKSVTSALIGIAKDKSMIPDMSEYVYTYFGNYPESPWIKEKYPVTIDNLLSMTSGLRWQPVSLQDTPDIIRMFESDDPLGFMFERTLDITPGTRFQYNDGNSIVLGKILEKSAHSSVNDFAKEYLFDPLGINQYTWDATKDGIARTDGGLRLRPRDMAKFGLLYLNNGRWNGRQIVSEAWVKNSLSRKTPPGQQEYGSHWWLKKFCINHRVIEAYCAIGHGEQFIIVVPELDMVAVFTAGNYFRPEHIPLDLMAQYILQSFIAGEHTSPYTPDSGTIRKVTGKYRVNADDSIIQISFENKALIALDPAHGKLDLIPVSETHYIAKQPPLEIVFVENGHGGVTCAELYENGIKVDEFMKQ